MGTARTSKGSSTVPEVGDWLLVTYNTFWDEPQSWWITRVEWTDGEQLLVRERTIQAFKPGARTLIPRGNVGFYGSKADCEAIHRAALEIRARYFEPIRAATVALDEVKDAAASEVRALFHSKAEPAE